MGVGLPWLGYACGDCAFCNSGRETLCESQQDMGYTIDGGFAEYTAGYARHVVRVPDGIDPADAAPLTCAGVTTYKAVKVSGVARPTASRSSASAAWGISPSSTRRSRARGRRRRHQGTARHGTRARRGACRQRRPRGSRGGDSAAGRRPGRDRHGGLRGPSSRRSRRLRVAGALWSASRPRTRWACRSFRPSSGAVGDRLDRRHPARPRGGLRVARAVGPEWRLRVLARRGQRGDRGRRAARNEARMVFRMQPAATSAANGRMAVTRA